LEQSINDRYNDLNDKYQLVYTQLDAVNVKLDNYSDNFQQVNTMLEEFSNKITILNEKVDSILMMDTHMYIAPCFWQVACKNDSYKNHQGSKLHLLIIFHFLFYCSVNFQFIIFMI
jgi:hypothetical protein